MNSMHARQRASGTWVVDGGGPPGHFRGGRDENMSHDYLHGCDVILGCAGVSVLGAASGEPAIVIRVKDIGSLVKSQSATGGVLYGLTPATMANIVYGQMRDKLAAGLKSEGVNADVTLTTSPPSGPPPKGDLLFGMSLGAGAVGVGWGLWHLIKHFGRR